MGLQIYPPLAPMEALSVEEIPVGSERQYEPKWNGFRCVAFRDGAKSSVVGSLLFGLYDNEGLLHHVGFTSAIANADPPALTKKVEKLVGGSGFTGKALGGPSRWNARKDTAWQPLDPNLVVEVCYVGKFICQPCPCCVAFPSRFWVLHPAKLIDDNE